MAIVQMKKVSLVILDAEKKESLKQLKKAGVLHLETIEGNSADLTALRESSQEVDKALGILEEFKLKKNEMPEQVKLSREDASATAKEEVFV